MRTLEFPASSVGTLHTVIHDNELGRQLADASGRVVVDDGPVGLRVVREHGGDLAFCAGLPADALTALWCDRVEDATQFRHVRHLVGLRSVRLGYALLGGGALEHLGALVDLEDLDLCAAWGLGEHVEQLARFRAMKRLGLYETSFGDGDAPLLLVMPSLTELDLGYTEIGDAGVATLVPLGALEQLILGETAVGDAACPALAELGALRCLHLNRTHVTHRGLARLAALPHLAELNLSGTPLDDAALHALAAMPALRSLNLGDIDASSAAVVRLRSALPACRIHARE